MNILLALILAVNACLLGAILWFAWKIYRVYGEFRAFIAPESEGKLSPFANVCQVLADMTGRSIVATLKSTFMGKQSGEARGEQAVLGDIIESSANPLVAGLINSFPALKKTIRRNPALLDIAMNFLSQKKVSPNSNHENESVSPKFEL